MTTPRRRILRAEPVAVRTSPRRQSLLRQKLERERSALARWTSRLKRAFNAMSKQQRIIARLERRIATLEEQP